MTIAVAHRGEPVDNRENTLPSFLAAVLQGADMVELDCRVTRTSVWWCCTTQRLSACGTWT